MEQSKHGPTDEIEMYALVFSIWNKVNMELRTKKKSLHLTFQYRTK